VDGLCSNKAGDELAFARSDVHEDIVIVVVFIYGSDNLFGVASELCQISPRKDVVQEIGFATILVGESAWIY